MANPSAPAQEGLDIPHVQRRTLTVVSVAQVFSGFGIAAGITVGALLAASVWDSTALTGAPAVIMTIGASVAALGIAAMSQRHGRRAGLAAGYVTGAVGAAGIIVAVANHWPIVMLLSFLVYGAGSAANLQARFTGADLALPERRARSMSIVLMATTLGAVLGPVSSRWSGDIVEERGLNPLLGPFAVACVAYAVGAAILWFALRPDPLLVVRELHGQRAAVSADDPDPDEWRGRVAAAIGIMVIAQAVMIAVMTMTPVHMTEHHHAIGAIGAVIAAHIAAMYVPSPLSGWLVDRHGSVLVAFGAGWVLIASGVVAAVVDPESVWGSTLALVLLGFGWSLGMVAGSAMLTSSAPARLRTRLQGRSDALTTLAGASGAGMAGVVMSWQGYSTLAWAAALLAAVMIPIAVLARTRR
ncbi:MFS transporter [Demequina sp.]|uniref:MFS transporter n=1 Tax=Demequina sp. TaxID=2050685 RepID=UPI003D0C392B